MKKYFFIFFIIVFIILLFGCEEKGVTKIKIGINKNFNTGSETETITIEILKNSGNKTPIWSDTFSTQSEKGVVLKEIEIEPGEYYIRGIEKNLEKQTIFRYGDNKKFYSTNIEEYNLYYINITPNRGFSYEELENNTINKQEELWKTLIWA